MSSRLEEAHFLIPQSPRTVFLHLFESVMLRPQRDLVTRPVQLHLG